MQNIETTLHPTPKLKPNMKKVILFILAIVICSSFLACDAETSVYTSTHMESISPVRSSTFNQLFELLDEHGFSYQFLESGNDSFRLGNRSERIRITSHYTEFFHYGEQSYMQRFPIFTVYEFDSREQAQHFTGYVGPFGMSINGPYSMINFTPAASVHWFIRGDIIVLYIGDEPDVVRFFRSFFGQRFAGID